MRQGVIYKITNPNGRHYIGQSVDVKSRLAKYKRLLCEQQKALYNSLLKYGFENHSIEIIYEGPASTLNSKEKYYIKKFNSRIEGLNLTDGGEGTLGRVQTKEEKEKRAESLRGQKRSEKTKKLMSLAAKGKPKILSEEVLKAKRKHAKMLAEKNKGTKKSPEQIEKCKQTRTLNRFKKHGHILKLDLEGNVVEKRMPCIGDIARELNMDPGTIRQAILSNGKVISAGYRWKYEKL